MAITLLSLGNNGNAVHVVRTQCKGLYVGKHSNPSFGPLGEHVTRHARGSCVARRFSLLAHPSTHRGSLKRSARAVRAQCNYLGVWPY